MAPGHGLQPILARAAAASPSQWTDAVVGHITAAGSIELHDAFSGEPHRVWTHHDLTGRVRVGDPVALHRRYGILALGRARWSVGTAEQPR